LRFIWVVWVLANGRLSLLQTLDGIFGMREPYKIEVSGHGQWIYALHDPLTGKVVYVGRSNNPGRRYVEHVNENCGTDKAGWIASLKRVFAIPYMTILEQCSSRNVHERERFWIDRFGGKGKLLNMTD